jgi:dihydrofolate synthase / folylpolyglutamate synthase
MAEPPAGTSPPPLLQPWVPDTLQGRLFPSLPTEVQWGLARTDGLLAAVGRPLSGTPILHVGGTNGKGSVARIWASILEKAGLRTGLYTSPHLISFRERILVDGRPLPDEVLEECAAELRPRVLRDGASWFEATTALAFLALERAGVEVAVVEVGLGGRLDATNVITPVLTAITNVAVEHRDMLGDTPAAIAREKAGILKAGVPAFTASNDGEVLEALRAEAATNGTPLFRVGDPPGEVSLAGVRLSLSTRRWGRLDLASPLVGRHQLANIALAVRSIESLPPRIPVPARAVIDGVAAVRAPGRFQVEHDGAGMWIFDVAHNPPAMAALTSTLDRVDAPRPRVALVGMLSDKDHAASLSLLASAVDRIILTVGPSTPEARRWDPAAGLDQLSDEVEARVIPDFALAVEAARTTVLSGGCGIVTGSFHTVGGALAALDRVPREALPVALDFG